MPHFSNAQVAARFERIADLLEIKGETRFKVLAYRRAAENIRALGRGLDELRAEGELQDVPGVGKAIHDKIEELFTTGEMRFWQTLTAEVPESLADLLQVSGVGPKTARVMWEHLDIQSLTDLQAAAAEGRLQGLPGIGAKTQDRILAGLEALARQGTGRFRLDVALEAAETIITALRDLSEVEQIDYAGSLRRFAPTIGDLDILVATTHPEPVMAAFRDLPEVDSVLLSGTTKTSVRLHSGLQADLRCVKPEEWGTALQYFSGSQAHNVRLRELAQKQGLSLNEYAITHSDGQTTRCPTEAEVYAALGLPFIPPVLREDRGEIEAAAKDTLPVLVEQTDIKGEVHCHSTWSDGQDSIEAMARAALDRGYEYLVITDHSQSLGVANGLTPERLRQQRQEIDAVQAKLPQLRLLQGVELEIKADGSLDFEDSVLAELDFVVASIHTGLRQDRQTLTQRALNAIYNPYVRVLGHPTGRLLGRREGSEIDVEKLLRAAAETGTMVEVNASPQRLDLDSIYVKRAIELGVKLVINCDAHAVAGFADLPFGLATAQRGWATASDIANTHSLEAILAFKRKEP